MNVVACALRRGLIAAALVVPVVASGTIAAAAAPAVVLGTATSRVAYSLELAPEAPETETQTKSGRQTDLQIGGGLASETGMAQAESAQSTTVRHGPTAAGYTVRVIRSVADLAGSTKLDDPAGGPVTAVATARSVADFTVNSTVPYAFSNDRSVGTDSYDPTKDCSTATVTLKRGTTVVYRRSTVTPGAGCSPPPTPVGVDGGDLSAGTYRLVTQVRTESAARKEYGTDFVGTMKGRAVTALTFGTGAICRNVLPGPGGATIQGTSGRDVLCGGSGPDTIKGFGGGDTLIGDGGADRMIGGPGADTISGGAAGDTIFGNSGNDTITPGGGADTVYAGEHNDTVRGCDNVKDSLYGQAGTDKVFRDAGDVIGGFEAIAVC